MASAVACTRRASLVIRATEVSASRKRLLSRFVEMTSPRMRSARSLTCCALSSLLAYSTRTPRAARAEKACNNSVLLPIPGSPPTSTALPGTSPPPSVRSNSPIPVGMRGTSSGEISAIGAADGDAPSIDIRPESSPSTSLAWNGSIESHAPHSKQRPDQRTQIAPHSLQTKLVFTLDTATV